MEKDYAKFIISKVLKKNSSLFISVSKQNEKFAFMLLNEALKANVEDIIIDYYDHTMGYKKFEEYINKQASFLFVMDNGYQDSLTTRICNGFLAKEIDIDFLVVPSYECLSKNDVLSHIPNNDLSFKSLISEYKRISTNIKNQRINFFQLDSNDDLELRMLFEGDVRAPKHNGIINLFPNYSFEFMAKEGSTSGFINATDTVKVDGLEIDGFRASIKNGEVIDFDCNNNFQKAKEIFHNKNQYRVLSFNLVGQDNPLFNKEFNNIVLDRSSKSYITIVSNDNKQIMLPIQAPSLNIDANTEPGKNINIYKDEQFNNKILRRK